MTNLTLFHPTPTLRRFFRDGFPGDAFFGTLFGEPADRGAAPEPPRWSPRVDVRDLGPEVVIEADLPGVRREDLSIRFDSGALTLEGRRRGVAGPLPVAGNGEESAAETPKDADPPASGTDSDSDSEAPVVGNGKTVWSHRERLTGRFRRTFLVPETVDVSGIRAETRDGVLTITLPKLEKALPRRIEVSVH